MKENNIKYFQLQLDSWLINPKASGNVLTSVKPEGGSDIRYPEGGLVTCYGKRFASESLVEASREARKRGERLVPVTIMMAAWRPESSNHWFDTWEDKTVFDLRRIKTDDPRGEVKHPEQHIWQLWYKYLLSDGYTKEQVVEMIRNPEIDLRNQLNYIARFPQYIDRLHKEPEFSHVDVFIWGGYEQGKKIARAVIYNVKNIISVRAVSTEPVEVQLPKTLQKAKAA